MTEEERPYKIRFSGSKVPVEAVVEIFPEEEIYIPDLSKFEARASIIINKKERPDGDQNYSYLFTLNSENFDIRYTKLIPTEEFDKILEKYEPF